MFRYVSTCRCCLGRDLVQYLDLGRQPLANSYLKAPAEQPTFPLQVRVCPHCFHSQLSVQVDPDVLFRDYLYVSGTTETFRQHTRSLAADAVRRVQEHEADYIRVLDIACNDGTQLEAFRELGCMVAGVDPARNLRKITEAKDIPVWVDYWSSAFAARLAEQGRSWDVLTATNVFAHVANPYDFLRGCGYVLNCRGRLFIEFPYGKTTFAQQQFDQVYHEHLSYFLVSSFAALARRAGFVITDLVETPIHGGSLRFVLQKDKLVWNCDCPELRVETPRLREYQDAEARLGLHDLGTYRGYGAKVQHNHRELSRHLATLKERGWKILGYGASAKGNTMLNAWKDVELDWIVDDNPLKHGYLTPGRQIPIHGPEQLAEEPGALVHVLTAWNFKDEIKQRLRAARQGNPKAVDDLLVTYVPTVQVEPLYE